MKNRVRNAHRWMRQSQHELEQAERLFRDGVYAYAAFFAEQAAQKSLKAFLISGGERLVTTHSVGELAKQSAARDTRFTPLIEAARQLDRHYLTSRYPDALPEPAIPFEAYSSRDAEEAVATARAIHAASADLVGR